MKYKEMIYQKDRKIELLFRNIYKGYNFYIFNLGTHPTAYIEIPKDNKLYGKRYNEIYDMGYDIDVHGGLTYSDNELIGIKSNDWFIGWDYAHCDDYAGYYMDMPIEFQIGGKKWTTVEIIKECESAINQIININGGQDENN